MKEPKFWGRIAMRPLRETLTVPTLLLFMLLVVAVWWIAIGPLPAHRLRFARHGPTVCVSV